MFKNCKKKYKVSTSVTTTWLISYILILLIPLFTSLFQYIYTNSAVVDQINRSNEKLLNNIQYNIDRILNTLDSSSTSIIFNDHFEKLFQLQNTQKVAFNYELRFCVDRLSVHYQANPNIDVTVYMPDKSYLIHSATANRISYIYDNLALKGVPIPQKEWIEKLSTPYRSTYFFSPYMSYRNFGKDSIVFARSVPLLAHSNVVANVFVSIPYSKMKEISDVSTGEFLILDDNGTPIKPENILLPESLTLTGNKGIKTIRNGKKEFILSYVKSNKVNWYYAVLTPTRDFWMKADYIRVISLSSIIIALFLGGISIYCLLKRNYKPVRNVVDLISFQEKTDSKNEFELIRDAYIDLYKENSFMKNSLSRQLERSREIYLLTRLKDMNSHLTDEDSMEYLQLDFEDKQFAIVSFYRSYTNEDIQYFDNDVMVYNNFILFVLNNIFIELTENKYPYYQLTDGELVLFLFVLDGEYSRHWESFCPDKLKQMYSFLKEKLDLSFYITIGEICNDFKYINSCYEDILNAHEYNSVIHEDGIVLVKDITEPFHHMDRIKVNYEKLLCDTIFLGNYRKASQLTDMIFDEFMKEADTDFSIHKYYIYHLVDAIIQAPLHTPAANISRKNLCILLDNITLCTNTQSLKKAFLNIIKAICGIPQEKYDERIQSLSNSIKNHVNANYLDYNLSIASIAESVNLNPKYMSRLFREENEEGLLDYINTVRIQKAKIILEAQDINLEDLALMVGYTNVRTFRRAFQKTEGITPGQYKNKSRT
ncbi:AraC family transcriptional regulator [Anaerocolumna sp. MB42-C2]|uniref:AraC family transcriptional regulator n=1 Tax=Anaerocolumna sp. MB42-C2 TaxID=3070997 RepID=UPI0027E03F84|nr:AraC family transcriptional regulator [Anaerocolumna sp. MB42-C2]WMJ86899.1 AraC family transcriptional regulator [Anaerocolumna sp. MB42-C2]